MAGSDSTRSAGCVAPTGTGPTWSECFLTASAVRYDMSSLQDLGRRTIGEQLL
jgi:hypothetical protein